MSKLNETDIQGFVLRGYNLPYARYCFLHFEDAVRARALLTALLPLITTGELWDGGKPASTLNLAFTHPGLAALQLPLATLISFPVEFQLGMKARAGILGDTGINAPKHWDEVWRHDPVHLWLAINASTPEARDAAFASVQTLLAATGGARLLATQDAAALVEDGKVTLREHFGFTDGFGNPDYDGICRATQPGQGKLVPGKLTPEGKPVWQPLATGELLLGHADEAGELPVSPVPHLLAANGTFMVYRKLHQNVGTFRKFLDDWTPRYSIAGGCDPAMPPDPTATFASREKLAAKFIGRWRDGTPLESSPNRPDPTIAQDPNRSTDFIYAADRTGTACPLGAHIRRVHPRDAFGFDGRLVNRRRITRRGLPYGPHAPLASHHHDPLVSPEEQAALDSTDRGVIFMALNASLARQFEFVQQQWINYGNDAHLGNDKDLLLGNHAPGEKYIIQGDATLANPPLVCTHLPNFVELRGGDYFFLPSITALAMLAKNLVDPR